MSKHGNNMTGCIDAPRHTDRPATCVLDDTVADVRAEAVGLVTGSATRDDEHAPGTVERCGLRSRGGANSERSEGRRQTEGADGLADHWDLVLTSWRARADAAFSCDRCTFARS